MCTPYPWAPDPRLVRLKKVFLMYVFMVRTLKTYSRMGFLLQVNICSFFSEGGLVGNSIGCVRAYVENIGGCSEDSTNKHVSSMHTDPNDFCTSLRKKHVEPISRQHRNIQLFVERRGCLLPRNEMTFSFQRQHVDR